MSSGARERFAGKAVLITGAAQGIGLACAQAFANEGASVMLADQDRVKGEAAAAAIGDKARFFQCDVGDKVSVEALVKATEDAFGGVDALVNNAGIIHTADFLDIGEDDFDRVIRVNLKGAFLVGQAVARSMVRNGRQGAIVNMSSVNAVLAIPNQVPYVTSKGGVNQLTKVMALSLAPHGIRVNGIGPGSIMTDILKVVMNDDAARHKVLARTPIGRVGEPEEIASVALFLASSDSSYLTGQTLYPDGGRMALNYTVPVAD